MATFPSKVNYATGDVLTATNMNDVGGAINLLAGAQYSAGKNKIINGDFGINQRGFTSITSSGNYGFDRWALELSGGTGTYTPQTFTLGTAPVAGYEGKNFARLAVTTGNDLCRLEQRIEDVRTFAGQTITISFWAKGTNPTTAGNLSVEAAQVFGTGGSPSTAVRTLAGTFVLTANWTRYSLTVAVPSISGKTIGTNNDSSLQIAFGQASNASTDAWTLDLWGVQVEAGSTASPFQTASGSIGGELALCQRYYYRNTQLASGVAITNNGGSVTTTIAETNTKLPVTMRVAPSSMDTASIGWYNFANTTVYSSGTLVMQSTTPDFITVRYTHGSAVLTAGQVGVIVTTANPGYIGFSAEL